MAEIDEELMARVLQWCAEAGRPSSPAEVRDALAPLSWDALLAVRAVLADAPPARPLGPRALVEIARGGSAEVAAERERENMVASGEGSGADVALPTPAAAPETRKTRTKATRRVATVVIRRARDRQQEVEAREAPRPLVDELFHSEGRAVVERWVRRHGARRSRLAEEVAAWRRPDGSPAGEEDLARLLDAHDLTRAFERRERAEILHAVRAAGGVLGGAARALGIAPETLPAVAERLGIGADVERIRDERREDIRRRATLGDRVRLLVDEGDRLQDLGMTAEIEVDLRHRLQEHVKALRSGSSRHVAPSFARTLGITRDQASAIAARFNLDLRDPHAGAWRDAGQKPLPPERAGTPRPGAAPRRPPGRAAPGRGAPSRTAPGRGPEREHARRGTGRREGGEPRAERGRPAGGRQSARPPGRGSGPPAHRPSATRRKPPRR